MRNKVIVVGAGAGGLAAAIDLARAGHAVTVLERAAEPGGKMRQVPVTGQGVDAGPTVFTMRWIFEQLFADAGAVLGDAVRLVPADILARHAWTGGGVLDLHSDIDASCAAISDFAGARDAEGYRAFCDRSRDIFNTLRDSFIADQRPGPVELVGRVGWRRLDAMWRTAPFQSLWRALDQHFEDPRLRQLFARYATYVGSSPLRAPATLMLIAHVEQDGVWLVEGGMRALAGAMQRLAEHHGACFRFAAGVEEILVRDGSVSGVRLAGGESLTADAVVFNGDTSALGAGLLGAGVRTVAPAIRPAQRGLSALTWCLLARTRGLPLHYHNVFFDRNYPDEFNTIFRQRDIVRQPTVYLCGQDRVGGVEPSGPERLLMLVNAPADGDRRDWSPEQVLEIRHRALDLLDRCGVQLEFSEQACVATTPTDFAGLFPGSGGSLYGRASHGMLSSFARPGARSGIAGLYLAGGSVHPGPGVPMATQSGRLAAAALLEDR